MKLFIKNMVCDRCKMVVKAELIKLGFNPILVKLGEVEIAENHIERLKQQQLEATLQQFGFELLIDKKQQLTEQIKATIVELAHYNKEGLKINLSAFLSDKLGLEYSHLSAIFSEIENNTIEKYFIQQKIEKVKELLEYGEKSLSEIAYQLNYSSVAHLSAQFKKTTGNTPTEYKLLQNTSRKTLDEI
ncbi:helix-turn-helix domain-containing protein [Pedobacter cryotolerans]|uniref:Helix-turn-helix transcriptional regulator n=1 Tax=Pedobacter cryotolerans TaxID=2571270 RepID=A0A4U1CCT1_9SPHI|nr:AraC family transcriptional regulator [Pedobacter cryotolerans]TKC03057.1 helix-turn-helix transcriptional regulator [Pedobacter cryotolerans]